MRQVNFWFLTIFTFLAMWTLTVLAQVSPTPAGVVISDPQTVQQALELIPIFLQFMKSGSHMMAAATLTLFVMFFFKKYGLPKLSIGTGALPLISVIVGIVCGISVSIVGGANLHQAAMAIMAGPMASTLWDAVVKYFVDKKKPA